MSKTIFLSVILILSFFILVLILETSCDEMERSGAVTRISTVECVSSTSSFCKVTVGKFQYCRDSRHREGVAIDCKIYEEAKRLYQIELNKLNKGEQ